MMKPNLILMLMFMILMINLMTTKTSMMCINMTLYTILLSMTMAMKMKLTPIPFITFLTMIGGLTIMFLYLAATMWTKKEILTLKTKILLLMTAPLPLMIPIKPLKQIPNPNQIEMFNITLNSTTILLIVFCLMVLMFTIEIHMKANLNFRRKLKIWE